MTYPSATKNTMLDALPNENHRDRYNSVAAEMGERLRSRIAEHHPSKFWEQVMG